jgi:phosphate/sulfate permease
MVEKLKSLLKSRRFWIAISSVLVVVMSDSFGIPEETANTIVAIGVSWIVGDSLRITE